MHSTVFNGDRHSLCLRRFAAPPSGVLCGESMTATSSSQPLACIFSEAPLTTEPPLATEALLLEELLEDALEDDDAFFFLFFFSFCFFFFFFFFFSLAFVLTFSFDFIAAAFASLALIA